MDSVTRSVPYDEQQQRLISAAFGRAPEAVNDWIAWERSIDWDDHLDQASFRLMPQLYRNLKACGVDHPMMNKFRGISRQAWLRNQRFFARLAPHLTAFKSTGVELLLWGMPALSLFQQDNIRAARHAAPLLIMPDQIQRALGALRLQGGHNATAVPQRWLLGYVAAGKTIYWNLSAKTLLQISTPLFVPSTEIVPGAELWSQPLSIEVSGHTLQTVSMQNQLLLLLHRMRVEQSRSWFSCAVDALLWIAAADQPVDWEHFSAQVSQQGLVAQAEWLLLPLSCLLPEMFSAQSFEAHAQTDASPLGSRRQNGRHKGPWSRLKYNWLRYQREIDPHAGWWTRLAAYPGYLMGQWHLQRPRELPGRIWRSAKHRGALN